MPLRFALIIIMCLSLSLTGCWDQNLLKNITLVLTSSIDQGENDCVQMSITYRKVQQSQGTQQANTGTYITTVLTTEAPPLEKPEQILADLLIRKLIYQKCGSC